MKKTITIIIMILTIGLMMNGCGPTKPTPSWDLEHNTCNFLTSFDGKNIGCDTLLPCPAAYLDPTDACGDCHTCCVDEKDFEEFKHHNMWDIKCQCANHPSGEFSELNTICSAASSPDQEAAGVVPENDVLLTA
ncbi:MAG: hypothetical protein KKF44_05950 [Nanoarchaeota archaeon]|nr:hypothetical protein [Nanoarchaeota archaeon]